MHQQFIRYAAIGLLLNATLYGVYLMLTRTLMGSQAAMTLTFCTGVLIGYGLNHRITFRSRATHTNALARYIGSYVIGYAINALALWWFVNRIGLAHEWVQGGMTLLLPVLLFAMQKYWVFHTPRISQAS